MLHLRMLAAAALLFAGLALGFVLGRMSVWLIPSAPGHDRPGQAVSEPSATAPGPQTASPASAPPAMPGLAGPAATGRSGCLSTP